MRFYGFLSFLGTFAHKVDQTWFVLHETWHTTLFSIYYFFELVKIENHSHMLEITCKLAILCVFNSFGTFPHKVDQTWFVLHETWHGTIFSVYFDFEVVRIENHSHMLEISC